jgi:hypothetical protein
MSIYNIVHLKELSIRKSTFFWILDWIIDCSIHIQQQKSKKLGFQSTFDVKNPKKLDFWILVGFLLDYWIGLN